MKRIICGCTTGRTETLEEYYLTKSLELTVVGQAVYSIKDNSYRRHYVSGYLVEEKKLKTYRHNFKPFIWLRWFWNIITNLEGGYDEYIGISQSFAFVGVILKRLGVVSRLVYYCIDYYHREPIVAFMDKVNCRYADEVWDISERINEKRKVKVKSKIVPLSFSKKYSSHYTEDVDFNRIVFVGCLMENQGLDIVCKAFPMILDKHPKAYMVVIGDGAYKQKAMELAKGLPIRFTGFMEEDEMLDMVSHSALGVALFTLQGNQNIICADPGKIKLYALCGLPVITTVHYKYDFGIMVDEKPESFASAVNWLLGNKGLILNFKHKSRDWGKQFITEEVMDGKIRRY